MNTIQWLNINELTLTSNNPRKIKDKDLNILVKSLKEDPELFEARPIIINIVQDEGVEKKIVIAGNQRLRASKILGLKEVPCFCFRNLSKEKQDKIMIKDNINNGYWDIDILKSNFSDINFEDLGLDIEIEDEKITIMDDILKDREFSEMKEQKR